LKFPKPRRLVRRGSALTEQGTWQREPFLSSDSATVDEPIEVVSADPSWPDWFKVEAARLREALPSRVFPGIEHIGSTAVPGLDAKPIIDIMLGIATPTSLGDCLLVLERLGYESLGSLVFRGDVRCAAEAESAHSIFR
jgi:GrpB-like predicted nucleotidyltransferase (UPF0157 family)